LSTELRQVNRLLKLDPKNTELLAQKQKVLSEAVDTTSDKLKGLKEAEKQVQDQFKKGEASEEQYRAIQQEVIKTEQDLKGLENQLKQVNNKWDDASKKMKAFGDKATDMGKMMLPATAVIGAAGVQAVRMSLEFDDALAKVSTISDEAQVPLEQLEAQIISLAKESGKSATEIAENVYNAISAGQETGDAVAFVGEAVKLSKAGFAETGEALDILTTVLNAYGLEASEVGRVSDMLIQTQNKGKVTVGELSSVMGKLIPTANGVGLGLDQVGAGYAILTSGGIGAAESTTYLNALLKEISKSGSKASNVLKKETGKSFTELIADGKSLSDVLMILDEAAKGDGLVMKDLFGSGEAGTAAAVLTKESGAMFNELQAQMKNSEGATQKAFEKMQTPGEKFKVSINSIQTSLMEFGTTLEPVFNSIAGAVEKVSNAMSELTPEQRILIVKIAAVVAAIGPLLIFIGAIAHGISGIMALAPALSAAAGVIGAAIGAITLPIALVIAAIAGLIAIGVLLYKNWDKVKEVAGTVFASVKAGIGNAIEAIKGFFSGLIESGKGLITSFKELGKNIIQGLIDGIAGMIGKVKEKIGEVAATIKGSFKSLLGINSPSTVFAGFGENTGEGFIEGIRSTKRDIDKATSSMLNLDGVQKSLNMGMGSFAVAGGGVSRVDHSGIIRVEGVNDKGQLMGAVDIVVERITNDLARQQRRNN